MKDEIYYQPRIRYDDDDSIEFYGLPEDLQASQVFPSADMCRAWLDNSGYDPNDFAVIKYRNDAIKDHVYIDSYGNIAKEYTVHVTFTTAINVKVWSCEADAKDEAEHKAAKIFEEQLNEGLLGTSDFAIEAQEL